jgi:tetratricopeptide (TPR) repeat protein
MHSAADDLIARLRRNPDDYGAFVALRAHYHQQGDWPSLVNLLEGWATRATDPRAASQAFYEAADLAVGALGDHARGVALYERTLERNPAHAEAYLRLEAIARESGDLQQLAGVLERRAEAMVQGGADPRATAAVQLQLGELYEQSFQRADRAVVHYRRAFELDPQLVPAIYAAREIYRGAGNLKATAQLYELEAAAETDLARRVSLLRELAHLRAERLHDLEGAIAALGRALGNAPGDLGVMHDLATMLLRRAESHGPSPAGEGDRRQAADLLFQMAQSVPPEHAVAYAESALDAAPDHDGAIALLERAALEISRPDLLPVRWVAFLQAAADAPGAMEMRRRLGEAYVEAGQLEDAIICFEPLLDAGDAAAAERLIDLYRQAGRSADVARALSVSVAKLRPELRAPRLREMMDVLITQGDRAGASQRAYELLQVDPASPDALNFLEDELRRRSAWEELRDLLQTAARVPGLGVDSRKQRLREVAALSADKMSDLEGAANAWRAVTSLDPADGDARGTLAKLLEKLERWDELVQVLERDALSTLDPTTKAEIFRRLGRLHRDQRQDLGAAADALQKLRELLPGDESARDELCDVLLELGAFRDAAPLLRQRIDGALRAERVRLLRILAPLLDEQLGDLEGAFDASTRLLDEEPGDLDALGRMERIDAAAERWDRLLQTLSYRAEVGQPEERAQTLARMGALADQRLGDLDRAAEYYGQALDLAPADAAALDALCDVYDRAERYRDLVELLRTRATMEGDTTIRAELYRRIARILESRVRNEDAASEAWSEVLAAGEDEEALRALAERARRRDATDELDPLLARLAAVTHDSAEARDLLVERADVLATKLLRPADAVPILRDVLDRLDGVHQPAILRLLTLSEQLGDDALLAETLERQLAATEDAGLRVPLAERLADLYEHRLHDPARTVRALYAWTDADLTDAAPLRRLVHLLEPLERWQELVEALDALAGLEQDDELVGAHGRRAAELAWQRLADADGAWRRLAARVAEFADPRAEEALRALALETKGKAGKGGEALAEFYVQLAQVEDAGPAAQAKRWSDAGGVYETYLGDTRRALEAVLRALALEFSDTGRLDEADRLAAAAGAWPRLGQVYDALLRRAETPAQKVALLVRHAHLLDKRAGDATGALDRALRACSLAAEDDEVLALAEDLAPRAGRAEELLVVYERRKTAAPDDPRRVEALLRAAKLADSAVHDREAAMHYVAQAVALAARAPELVDVVETAVRALDAPQPGSKKPGAADDTARRGLVGIYLRFAEGAPDRAASAQMLTRAARLLDRDLRDEGRAFEALKQAATATPGGVDVLDELTAFAERTKKLPALDAHLAELVGEAFDPKTAIELARRRGALLANRLGRHADAAEVYRQLLTLAPADRDAARELRLCLGKAGRHQDVLVAIDRELETTKDPAERAALLRDTARVWEGPLKNRYEALDVWKKVRALLPGDDETLAAIARLEKNVRRSADEDDDEDAPLPPPPANTPAQAHDFEEDDVTGERSTPPPELGPRPEITAELQLPDAVERDEDDDTSLGSAPASDPWDGAEDATDASMQLSRELIPRAEPEPDLVDPSGLVVLPEISTLANVSDVEAADEDASDVGDEVLEELDDLESLADDDDDAPMARPTSIPPPPPPRTRSEHSSRPPPPPPSAAGSSSRPPPPPPPRTDKPSLPPPPPPPRRR